MKVAVIGAGQWGINLVRTFNSLQALGAIVEDSSERRADLKREFPQVAVVERFDSSVSESCDAVAIATPVSTHFELSLQALQAGLDVFVEKPMTLNLAEAEQLTEVANSSDCILMVGHLLLYQPAIRWLKQYIDDGAIGKVFAYHQNRLGFGKVRHKENALLSLGVHDLSVLTYLAGGAPVRISTTGQSEITPNIEDDVHCHLWFEDSSVGHLHVSWLWPERERKLTVIGEKGMLVYDELTSCVTHHKTI